MAHHNSSLLHFSCYPTIEIPACLWQGYTGMTKPTLNRKAYKHLASRGKLLLGLLRQLFLYQAIVLHDVSWAVLLRKPFGIESLLFTIWALTRSVSGLGAGAFFQQEERKQVVFHNTTSLIKMADFFNNFLLFLSLKVSQVLSNLKQLDLSVFYMFPI